jgi:hypothetical protein
MRQPIRNRNQNASKTNLKRTEKRERKRIC